MQATSEDAEDTSTHVPELTDKFPFDALLQTVTLLTWYWPGLGQEVSKVTHVKSDMMQLSL